jgi:TctA family transporter
VASVVGGLAGAALLSAAAPRLASVALSFTTYEYFWLTLLGLTAATVVSGGSVLKSGLALVIGLLLSTIGLGEVHSAPRFTFGRDELVAGVNFVPAMIGLFGLSEVLRIVSGGLDVLSVPPQAGMRARLGWRRVWGFFERAAGPIVRRKLATVRSSLVGAGIGMLPGAGADIAAWISYGVSQRFSTRASEYGRGSLDGVADSSTANNAALAGAWIPALVFGIPGDSITAIVIGVLLMKNVTPGPDIFANPRQAALLYSIYITFVLANLLLIPLGYLAVRSGVHLVRIPRRILVPVILIFCIVGAYAINGSYFDVWVMLALGVLGFLLERFGVPLGPVVLGIVLGGKLEQTFIQSATKTDSWIDFVNRPVSAFLAAATLLLWAAPLFMRRARHERTNPAPEGS